MAKDSAKIENPVATAVFIFPPANFIRCYFLSSITAKPKHPQKSLIPRNLSSPKLYHFENRVRLQRLNAGFALLHLLHLI
jgi:hypothetical protein